jgi:hypothetical protein
MRPTAEQLFTETFRRFNNNWNVISAIRQFLMVTERIAPLAMEKYHASQMEVLSSNPQFRKIFGDCDKPLSPELMNLMQTGVTQLVLSNASAAIDAASLVFAQSIVDDAAWSYLKVCAMIERLRHTATNVGRGLGISKQNRVVFAGSRKQKARAHDRRASVFQLADHPRRQALILLEPPTLAVSLPRLLHLKSSQSLAFLGFSEM